LGSEEYFIMNILFCCSFKVAHYLCPIYLRKPSACESVGFQLQKQVPRKPALGFSHVRWNFPVGYQWLMPIILTTQEAEMRRIKV
jgi:hypothetical protein